MCRNTSRDWERPRRAQPARCRFDLDGLDGNLQVKRLPQRLWEGRKRRVGCGIGPYRVLMERVRGHLSVDGGKLPSRRGMSSLPFALARATHPPR
jgi:hypothetical protein